MNTNKRPFKAIVGSVVLLASSVIIIAASGAFKDGNATQNKHVSWAQRAVIDPGTAYPVVEVIDGDTLKTIIDGHDITVRLLGIDTPEVVDPRKPVACFGSEASAETKSLLSGESVFLELNQDYDRVDKYGRLLAYVRRAADSLLINGLLVEEGYAREYTFDNKRPYRYQREFKAAESEARKAKKGLWGACY